MQAYRFLKKERKEDMGTMNSTEVENIMIILHEVDKEQEQDLQEH